MNKLINIITNNFIPYSIFIYGSSATNTKNNNSDCEIGIIFDDGNYINRERLNSLVEDKKTVIFPFRLSEILNYSIDTPFEKKYIYFKYDFRWCTYYIWKKSY